MYNERKKEEKENCAVGIPSSWEEFTLSLLFFFAHFSVPGVHYAQR
jgi:hypothetical protein